MAKQPATKDAVWHILNPADLPEHIQALHRSYKAQYEKMKADREAFEMAMAAAISPPAGKRVVFGYNFGKLSVAVVADDRKPSAPKPTTGALDLRSLAKG